MFFNNFLEEHVCEDDDVLLHPKLVEVIRDQKENVIRINDIADNQNGKGWSPAKGIKYFDIKLKEGQNITKIKVVDGSNVKNFYLELVDIKEKRNKIKVYF